MSDKRSMSSYNNVPLFPMLFFIRNASLCAVWPPLFRGILFAEPLLGTAALGVKSEQLGKNCCNIASIYGRMYRKPVISHALHKTGLPYGDSFRDKINVCAILIHMHCTPS